VNFSIFIFDRVVGKEKGANTSKTRAKSPRRRRQKIIQTQRKQTGRRAISPNRTRQSDLLFLPQNSKNQQKSI